MEMVALAAGIGTVEYEFERAGIEAGDLRRLVQDRPWRGGRRADEHGAGHPGMVDPGILQRPALDDHPDRHRLAYHRAPNSSPAPCRGAATLPRRGAAGRRAGSAL